MLNLNLTYDKEYDRIYLLLIFVEIFLLLFLFQITYISHLLFALIVLDYKICCLHDLALVELGHILLNNLHHILYKTVN